jgi:RNA polymerase sigma-70 factor (ECF subfamily)
VGQGGMKDTQLSHDEQDMLGSRLNDLPDHDLIKHIALGHSASFAIIVFRYTDRYLAMAQRVLGDREEAKDAIQDAFIKLWEKAQSFDPNKAKFSTWFYRIVLNQCLDKKRKKRPISLPENFDIKDESINQEQQADETQTAATVKAQLDRLPDKQKTAIILCYFEGLSNKEAAEVLDLNIKALESLLSRGRKTLAQTLAPHVKELLNPL